MPLKIAEMFGFWKLNIKVLLAENKIEEINKYGEKAIPVVVDYLSDPSPIIRKNAVKFLANRSSKEAVPHLLKLLTDSSCRVEVIRALRKIGDTSVTNKLKELLGDLDREVRKEAWITLKSFGEILPDEELHIDSLDIPGKDLTSKKTIVKQSEIDKREDIVRKQNSHDIFLTELESIETLISHLEDNVLSPMEHTRKISLEIAMKLNFAINEIIRLAMKSGDMYLRKTAAEHSAFRAKESVKQLVDNWRSTDPMLKECAEKYLGEIQELLKQAQQ